MTRPSDNLSEAVQAGNNPGADHLDVVIAGHVDDGKSSVIGRILADTGALPEGKLAEVRARCARNARPFEYAFLLDALKDEQSQGITIDTARCFFKTARRHYVINDAPGHIEFLRNMVTGAARAEAALLVIDASEGVRENSRRHGYLLSLLGLRQVAVIVNKMDLVAYDEAVYDRIRTEYLAFMRHVGVEPAAFIPVSAREGDNLSTRSERTPWYTGPTVIGQLDRFEKPADDSNKPFRMPVQDIYRFTEANDDRRIVAGTIETGTVRVGDAVRFLPSGKGARIRSIEGFHVDQPQSAAVGEAPGFTLDPQIYIRRGELMVREDEPAPWTGTRFRATIFWMGAAPLVPGRRYPMKIGAARVPVEVAEILHVLDASEMTSVAGKQQVDRHDVAECVFETARPVACDIATEFPRTARFVLIDDYEIAGCGVVMEAGESGYAVLKERVTQREFNWEAGEVSAEHRREEYGHDGKFVVFVAPDAGRDPAGAERAKAWARHLEQRLFDGHYHTYGLSMNNLFNDLETPGEIMSREEHLLQLGQIARLMTDAGLLFITTLPGADDADLAKLRVLNQPYELFVVAVGDHELVEAQPEVLLDAGTADDEAVQRVVDALTQRAVIPDYSI